MSKNFVVSGILILLFVILGLFSLNDLFFYTPDSARYVAWAQSLSQGTGFTDYTSPETSRYVVHSPLYSLLLAPIAGVFSGNIVALKTLNVLLAAFIMLLLYGIVHREGNPIVGVIVVALFAAHPIVNILSTQILSEIVFGLFFVLLLYLLTKEEDESSLRSNFLLLIAAVTGCVFSREIGLVTIVAVTVYFAMQKQYTKAIVIFFIPLILYLIWYIRNEAYYASLENLDFRNSMLLLSNVYTSADTGYGVELWMRISNNAIFYCKELSIILFASPYNIYGNTYTAPWMLLVHQQESMVASVIAILGMLKWFIIPASIGLVGFGMGIEIQQKKKWYMKFIFLAMYLFIILVYPVMDVRFLFPVLILFLLWTAKTLEYLVSYNNRAIRVGGMCVIALLSIPNIIWTSNFIVTQNKLRHDPLGTFMASTDPRVTVNRKQIIEPLAAEWLNQRLDSADVVVYPRKELALYLKKSKVIILNDLTSLKAFNNTLRDYAIRYIVCGVDVTGWRDYEYQIGLNTEYSFEKVFDNESCEIYRVHPYTQSIPNKGTYAEIFEPMRAGNDSAVNEYFMRNRVLIDGSPDAMYWTLVNKHLIGEMDSVRYYARLLYTVPQGLLYTRSISKHLTALDRRALSTRVWNPQQRSNLLMALGVNYWDLDMDRMSMRYFRESLESDSSAALAYVYNIILGYQTGDSTYAEEVSKRFSENFPNAELSIKMATLVQMNKALTTSADKTKKSAILEEISDSYAQFGFYDFAIDNALHAIRIDPKRVSMYYKLGLIYDIIRKHYPSLLVLQKGWQLDKGSTQIDSLLNIQKNKLYLNI